MVIDDILWKLFRKSLSPGLYEKLRLGVFGRPKKYLSLQTYEDIFNHYKSVELSFQDKVVIEIGPGLQFYTSFFFLSHGAKKVILVEPAMPPNYTEILEENLNRFCGEKKISKEKFSIQIECYKSLHEVPQTLNNQIDIICSHFVLEHFEDLNEYFSNAARLLTKMGTAYAHADFTDHTYHLFDSRKITKWLFERRKLYHLRYSKKMYDIVSDGRTKSNRVLFPFYRKLAKLNNLLIDDVKLIPYKRIKVNRDLLIDLEEYTDREIYSTYASFKIKK